jgi:hypothetical protein
MRMISKTLLGGFMALVALPCAAFAAGPVSLESGIKLDKVITENGKTRHEFVAPEKVVPGNHLVFVTQYRNTSDKPVDKFVVVNPVPNVVALEPSATDAFEVSVDGGKSWGALAALKVSAAGESRAAQATDVTHVRWVIPVIAAGASGSLEYHALVR